MSALLLKGLGTIVVAVAVYLAFHARESTAYWQGRKAFKNGQALNPHNPSTKEYFDWRRGYQDEFIGHGPFV